MWNRATFMGGAQGLDISADFNLPTRVARLWVFDPQSGGLSVRLPDARRIQPGHANYLMLNESGTHSLSVRDSQGTLIVVLDPGDHLRASLIDNATAAGTWHVPGSATLWTPGALGALLVDWWPPDPSTMTKPGGGTPSDGDDVDTWTGSENGVVLTAVSSGTRPRYLDDVDGSGNPGVEHKGAFAFDLRKSGVGPSIPWSLACHFNMGGSSGPILTVLNGASQAVRAGAASGFYNLFCGTHLFGSAIDSAWHYGVWEADGASSRIRIDGSTVASGDSGSTDAADISLGGAASFVGKVRHVVLHDALPAGQLADLETWLADN